MPLGRYRLCLISLVMVVKARLRAGTGGRGAAAQPPRIARRWRGRTSAYDEWLREEELFHCRDKVPRRHVGRRDAPPLLRLPDAPAAVATPPPPSAAPPPPLAATAAPGAPPPPRAARLWWSLLPATGCRPDWWMRVENDSPLSSLRTNLAF